MGLLSFLQRRPASAAAASAGQDADSVSVARSRARRRLVGATVLVLLGVVGFPLLFDTAPRPLPIDIAIEIPRKDAMPPLESKPATSIGVPAATATIRKDPVPTERASGAGRELPAAPAEPRPSEKPAARPVEKSPDTSAVERMPAAEKASEKLAEAARAKAALEGKPVAKAAETTAKTSDAATRFVVQVGAFSEADSAREARARVEKLGLKTYTQVVETAAGKRIRVRLGPYGERGEAEKIAGQLKQAGLPSAVLTL